MLWLATFGLGPLRAYANANDYSYGTYIYSYPVTQAILQLWPQINPVSLVLSVLGVTLALAFLSWELVERPALDAVRGWRARLTPEAARAQVVRLRGIARTPRPTVIRA
jgi:peptidoglycan/LPS O-acetylase OafA/YrhL